MINEKEAAILSHLRKNSRKALVKIGKDLDMPISTVFEKIKKLESDVILRHVSLVDFSKLGYSLKVNFILTSKHKSELKSFLVEHPNVNSLSALMGNHDFYAECIFKDLKEAAEFKDNLRTIGTEKLDEIYIIEDIKREEFGVL